MGVDFLDFLRSGKTDIHAFAASRPRPDHDQPAAAKSTAASASAPEVTDAPTNV